MYKKCHMLNDNLLHILQISVLWLMPILISANASSEETQHLPMPPKFNLDSAPEKLLENYPLGMVNKVAAFSHHGASTKEITFPNGRTGWVYDIGRIETHRIYILVFDTNDYVSDVLYYDHGKYDKFGISALLIQTKQLFPATITP